MKGVAIMKSVKDTCYEWFNATSRKDWNDWSIDTAKAELKMLKSDL